MTTRRWSCEKAWEWYNAHPWIRGCNFMSSDCCNRIDQWQTLGFEERFTTTDRELALAASIGFNSIRLIVQFEIWDQEHDAFMEHFERYLTVAHKHGISCMICFANDCSLPPERYVAPHPGPQKVDWGYHGGVKNSPHNGIIRTPGYTVLDDPVTAKRFFVMLQEILGRYRKDPRIIMWDLINEPGASNRGEISGPNVDKLFEAAREMGPEQPLTSCVWASGLPDDILSPAEERALAQSDIISFHWYRDFCTTVKAIARLRRHGRPLVNTEWLHRIYGQEVREIFPLFYLEKIGCYNWGFVAGLYQTYEPWETIWNLEESRRDQLDLTRWQHDLFRPSLRPYDPGEIKVIREFCTLADRDFADRRG